MGRAARGERRIFSTKADQLSIGAKQNLAGGGRGFGWGRCVRFRYGNYGPRPYYARRWGGSDDYSAAQLNRQQLGQFNRY
jgi:hypothetical protein